MNKTNSIKEKELEEEKRKWWDENLSHGAFAYTQEELDFYFNPERWKTPTW